MDSKITEITAAQKENAMVDLSDISAVKGKYGEVYEIGTVVDEDDESEGRKISFYFRKPTVASFNRGQEHGGFYNRVCHGQYCG